MTEKEANIPHFRRIGAGSCGTVWAPSEKGPAFKREDGGPERSLANDYEMHQRVLHSIRQLSDMKSKRRKHPIHPRIQIPHCHRFIKPTDESWWTENLSGFPAGYSRCNIIHSQRIPPFPETTRELLTRKYCPPEIAHEIMNSDTNKDCLIRPYLGRRRRTQQNQTTRPPSKFKAFSLRNYPLHADQMEELGISPSDMQLYARTMAEAIATMHWIGEIDGNDVEFVLAPPPPPPPPPDEPPTGLTNTVMSNILGEHTMWILDFDLCRNMSMDENGVRQAVTAYWRNDPFFPRPESKPSSSSTTTTTTTSTSLWKVFREQYLRTSEECLENLGDMYDTAEIEKRLFLSRLFVDLVEEGECRSVLGIQ